MKRWEIYLDIIMELLVILAGAVFLVYLVPKCLGFLWPFVVGWIISMIAHPVIEYLEKKVRLPKKFGSAILIAVVLTAILAVLYFVSRALILQIINFVQGFPDLQTEIQSQFIFFSAESRAFS